MIIKSADFVMSNSSVEGCPKTPKPEYAFIGRSNVGKSSLINMLCQRKSLAKTSGTPGKTQLINHFEINKEWYLVDLPGYGYAKVSKSVKSEFGKIITDYILKRDALLLLFVLVDSRLAPQPIDLRFMSFLGERGVPFNIVFTKTDKLKPAEFESKMAFYRQEMLKEWDELPQMFYTSASHNKGRDELLDHIDNINSQWRSKEGL
jgi:GTP-binding protein